MTTVQIGRVLKTFAEGEDGVTAIEYALLAALIFLAILASVRLMGDAVVDLFDTVAAKFPLAG